jgi:hypothetical protein
VRPARKSKPVPAFVVRRRAQEARAKSAALYEWYYRQSTDKWTALSQIARHLGLDGNQGAAMSQQDQELASFTLPAGTVCKRNGIPFELAADAVIRCHPENWPLIRDEFVPTVNGQPVERGYSATLARSQSEQGPRMPSVAQSAASSITNSSSLSSSCCAHKSRT